MLAQQINGPCLVYCMVQAQGNSLCSLAQLPASSVYTFLIPRNRGEGYLRPYNGLYETALPERGTFFRLQVYGRVGILLVEVYDCL